MTITPKHRHRPATADERPFAGAVSPGDPNPAAHGGICYVERCDCGAERRTNINGRHFEFGPWVEPVRAEDDRP